MELMLRVYRFIVSRGEMSLAHEVARSLLEPHRVKDDKAAMAALNENFADVLYEFDHERVAKDFMRRSYDGWVELADGDAMSRCALKMAKITFYADLETETLSWTDKVLELATDYETTVRAYRLQIAALRELKRYGAALDSLKQYLHHIKTYSGNSRPELAAHRIVAASIFFESEDYEACLRALAEWYELLEDKARARPFFDGNTAVVLSKLRLDEQAHLMLREARNLAMDDRYEADYPFEHGQFYEHFYSDKVDATKGMPGFMECDWLK